MPKEELVRGPCLNGSCLEGLVISPLGFNLLIQLRNYAPIG